MLYFLYFIYLVALKDKIENSWREFSAFFVCKTIKVSQKNILHLYFYKKFQNGVLFENKQI